MQRKLLTETSRVSSRTFGYYKYTTGLSFAEERIGPLAAIVTTVFYLLALYLLVLPNTPENLFASIYSDSLVKTAHQHLLLLVGFDTLIYRKYYDTPPILVGHQWSMWGTAQCVRCGVTFFLSIIEHAHMTAIVRTKKANAKSSRDIRHVCLRPWSKFLTCLASLAPTR
jgi:hypothetical protein